MKTKQWREEEKVILQRSQIVCCTLSMAGSEKMLTNCKNIDYLIVDEACQCNEISNLIPLQLDPNRVILVGDQKQLPATTHSVNSQKTNFSKSLFERLLEGGFEK